ncbi:hypothetical protein MKZ38_001851 [Zalerion maritima]|uniref:Uncharacterized protein n=1 Tax=Zalerion maritima TaxID=339359 RepID=A0AAD5RET8_9PEZI|nr:hypothetical protein MKZ38_001851 [Zalerion maritima]
MCYFEQTRWSCGYWKWGHFRQQCNKEYRMGETCGLKLVWETIYLQNPCKLCDDIAKKRRRIDKLEMDIARWQSEGNRRATIEKASADWQDIQNQISRMWDQHMERTQRLS